MPVIVALLTALAVPIEADDLVPEHGRYSETYQSDWAQLPTGKELAARDPTQLDFRDVVGEDVRQVIADQEEVRIADQALRVHWNRPECDKYRSTLFLIRNCEKVVIENMAVIQTDADFRASSTFFLEDCGSVTIRDSYLAGSCDKAMIRIEGCREYFIDRVEVSGDDHGEDGVLSGPGIFINNGAGLDPKTGKQRQLYSQNPRELEFGVIQNCYIHDYPQVHKGRNHDGILFHAPADGIVFNCVFENYEGDSCLDISHRRNDAAYRDHVYRIERCIFDRCHRVKTNGAVGSADCALIWANNLYLDSAITDYHVGWPNWHLHETFAYTHRPAYFLTMNCRDKESPTLFVNCLLHGPHSVRNMYEPWANEGQEPAAMRPDYFLYFMAPPQAWLRQRGEGGEVITTWREWQRAGFDTNSKLLPDDPAFVDAAGRDFRPRATSAVVGAGAVDLPGRNDPRLAVTRDFAGQPRPMPPSCGAFEPAL